MIHTDKADLYEKIDVYVYGDIEGRNKETWETAQAVWEKMTELEEVCFFDGEIAQVLNFFKDSGVEKIYDPDLPQKNPLSKVRKNDAVYLAMHFGFLYGLIFAENSRLHFD